MKWLRRLFLHDLGRKLLALGLAVFVWWRVALSIADPHDHTFQVVQIAEAGTPVHNSIEVVVPEGWMLVEPRRGSSISIRFHGTEGDISKFFASQCAATFIAQFNASPSDDEFTLSVRPEELEWLRPRMAKVLLAAAGEQEIPLRFERSSSLQFPLEPGAIDIVGSPQDDFLAVREEMSFEPNGVTLRGPVTKLRQVDQLMKDGQLLTSLEIPVDSAQDLHRSLRLSARAHELGLTMVPAAVEVVLPIRANYDLFDAGWVPKESAFQLVGMPPSAPPDGKQWTFAPPQGAWRVLFQPVPGLDLPPSNITEDFLDQHVLFLVPLNLLPEGALDGTQLNLEVKVLGGDLFDSPEQIRLLERSLKLTPFNPGEWKVRLNLQ